MYKQIAIDYLNALENKGALTLKSTLDKQLYLAVEEEYAKERDVHCECSARLKASKREQYLDVIKAFHSLFGEITQNDLDLFEANCQAFINFKHWYFTEADEQLIEKLEKINPDHTLIKLWNECREQRNG